MPQPNGEGAWPRGPEELQLWLEAHQLTHVRRVSLSVVEPLLERSFRDTPGLQGLEHLSVTAPLDGTLELMPRGLEPAVACAEQAAAAAAASTSATSSDMVT